MQPSEEKVRQVRQWLGKAEGDLILAERGAYGEPPVLDGALFHCQQAAEKAIKAYLVWHDRPLPRTHDLSDRLKSAPA